MGSGIETTFRLLTKTENRTAVSLLAAAMDGTDRGIRLRAVRAALTRPDSESNEEVLKRLDRLDPQAHVILNARGAALVEPVRHALAVDDAARIEAVCESVCAARLYDAITALLAEMSVCDERFRGTMADAVLRLTDELYDEVRDLPDETGDARRTMLLLRRRIATALESGARRWLHHKRDEVVEAYLLLAKPQDPTLNAILQHPDDPTFDAVVRVLGQSRRGGIIRLLLGFLSESRIPPPIRDVIASRTDLKFAQSFLQSVGERPTRAIREKLKQFKGFRWAQPDHPLLSELDERSQTAAPGVVAATGADRNMVAQFVEHLATSGNVGGRRGAALALEHLDRVRAERLILTGLSDPDPQVRASMAQQLRPRRIPQALILLVRLAEDPSPEVHEAVRASLPEFRVKQFLRNYERISEELLPVAGELIRKIDDLEGPVVLEGELQSESSARRRRAVEVATAMALADRFESDLVSLLDDDNHTIRKAAVTALATSRSRGAWRAVVNSLYDPSPLVQEAAEMGLRVISASLRTDAQNRKMNTPEGSAPPAAETVPLEPIRL